MTSVLKTTAPRQLPPKKYLRSYPHSVMDANAGKKKQLLDLFYPYCRLAAELRAVQLKCFFTTGAFNKMLPVAVETPLSARYRQTCQYQVVAMLTGWVAQRQDDFRDLIVRSSLDGDLCRELLLINKCAAWYSNERGFSATSLRQARNIFRHLCNKNSFPEVNCINLALDAKVATVENSKTSKHFKRWVKLATLTPGKPIYLPLGNNPHFDAAGGLQKAFVQLNLSESAGLAAVLIKEHTQKAYTPGDAVLALDAGLCVLFATDQGELCGLSLFERLQVLDGQITDCAKGRQRRGLRVRCPRYDRLVQRVRGSIKNEIGRILNTLVDRHQPAEIVVESLDFRDSRLSKRMNRLVRNFGRRVAKEKLVALTEEYGIVVTEVPCAFSSQECPNCHHVEKSNRATRSRFSCKCCGYTRHADVVGARNVRARRSWPTAKGVIPPVASFGHKVRREVVLRRAREAHQLWCAQRFAVREGNGVPRGTPAPQAGIAPPDARAFGSKLETGFCP